MNVNIKKRYRPDINRFLSLCSRNYVRILTWLPDGAVAGACWQVKGSFGCLAVRLLENTKYTQLIDISRELSGGEYVNLPSICVRVYHDAKLAEVLTSRQIYRLRPVYDYPNLHMHQRDEKYQVNAFLEELLKIDSYTTAVCLTET